MSTKKAAPVSDDVIAAARKRAERDRQKFAHKPGPAEVLTTQELAEGAPFYFVLRNFVQQLKDARLAAGLTLVQVSEKSGIAVESLSRLETGAQTNPTWKTLGMYAVAVGQRPELTAEADSTGNGEN